VKDSKHYSKKVAAFIKKYQSKTTLKPFDNDDKVDNLVYSVLYEHLSSSEVDVCAKLLREHFVDWNDLRVCRQEEVLDVLSHSKIEEAARKKVALQLIKCLNCVFEKYDRISFEDIDELGKRQAHQELSKLEAFTPFMIDFLMLNFKASHSLPLNEVMIEFAKSNDLVDEKSDNSEANSFLLRQVSVDNVYDFYLALREQAELDKAMATQKQEQKVAASKKSKPATAKKKSAVKKATKKATASKAKPAAKKTVAKKATAKKVAAKKKTAVKTDKEATKKVAKKTVAKKATAKKATKKAVKKTTKKVSKPVKKKAT